MKQKEKSSAERQGQRNREKKNKQSGRDIKKLQTDAQAETELEKIKEKEKLPIRPVHRQDRFQQSDGHKKMQRSICKFAKSSTTTLKSMKATNPILSATTRPVLNKI